MLARLLQTLRGPRSVDEVAKALRVSRSVVYLWESTEETNERTGKPKHRRLPELDNLEDLLDLYGASEEQRNEARAMLAQAKRLAKATKSQSSDDASDSSEDSDPSDTPLEEPTPAPSAA